MRKESDGNNVVKVNFANAKTSKSPQATDLNEKKRALFGEWLKAGTVLVLLDARKAGTRLPPQFADNHELRLNFSYQFLVPDFNFNATAVWASLSFAGLEFFCLVPWDAVYGMQSVVLKQNAVWFESFPKDQDQMAVLGFDEEMCKTELADGSSLAVEDNVIRLDFSS